MIVVRVDFGAAQLAVLDAQTVRQLGRFECARSWISHTVRLEKGINGAAKTALSAPEDCTTKVSPYEVQ